MPEIRSERPFHPEQFLFQFDSARVARQAAIRPDHPVAGNDQRDRIVTDRAADRPRGRAANAGPPGQPFRDLS